MTTEKIITLINKYKRESELFIQSNPGCISHSWEITGIPQGVYIDIAHQFDVPLNLNSQGVGRCCISDSNCFIHLVSNPF